MKNYSLKRICIHTHRKVFLMKALRFVCLFGWLFISSAIFATSKQYTFLFHSNNVFVETGTFYGEGVQRALAAGFKEIYSIELSPKYFFLSKSRFAGEKNVSVLQGDSGKILFDIIKDIDESITFWLDGHCSGEDTAYGESMTPILKELDQIKRHHIKTHTILIDDVRLFGTWEFDHITKEQILAKLYEINPNYTITYENGFVEGDILVAKAY